jgi:ubiquinone biosynthesis UbiH/UbiF/VisC/COQ6 family hydroxylase
MAQQFDVCIRGSGIVGSSLALLLAQQRLRVGLVRGGKADKPASESDVRAYALNVASRRLLTGLRCWPEGLAVTPVSAMRVHGDDGGLLNFVPLRAPRESASPAVAHSDSALAWIVDVPALEDALRQALRFAPQIELLAEPVDAALTVVCEGRASATRAEFGVEAAFTAYGQHAIAARLDCEVPHGGVAEQWFESADVLGSGSGSGSGDVLAFLPLNGPSGRSVALVWSASAARATALAALSPEEFAVAVQAACGHSRGALTLISDRATWPLVAGSVARWVGRKGEHMAGDIVGDMAGDMVTAAHAWALAGDAAHAVHPLAGQGLNLGLADVAELARVLGARAPWRSVGDLHVLRQYERARRADLAPVATVIDGLQRLFAQTDPPVRHLRNAGMRAFERSGPLKSWVVRQAMGWHTL